MKCTVFNVSFKIPENKLKRNNQRFKTALLSRRTGIPLLWIDRKSITYTASAMELPPDSSP